MSSPDSMAFDEAQIQLLFEEAQLVDVPVPDMHRVDKVVSRAMHENVIKDTTSFVFLGFPAVISEMVAVATGNVGQSEVDYRT